MLGVTVDLRHFNMLCLLTLEVLGGWDVMGAFLVLHLLGQLSNTKEIIHSLKRETFGLRNTVRKNDVSAFASPKESEEETTYRNQAKRKERKQAAEKKRNVPYPAFPIVASMFGTARATTRLKS